MNTACKGKRANARGFTLVELAVVFSIVALLLGSLMYTLSAQVEQRNFEDTRRRIEQARELVLSFAIVNGRLPCPARANSAGVEVRNAVTGECKDGANVEDYYGGNPGGVVGGLLPAATIGFQPVDGAGFALDAWQNRIRYAVAKSVAGGTCAGAFTNPHFVNAANMKGNGIACQPGDLLVCRSATGIPVPPATTCGGAANQIMTTGLVVAIVFSTGPNGATTGGTGADEAVNLNGDPIFVSHPPVPLAAANGEFDDQFTWITVGELYGRLIAAGQLP
jgi:type II secretory pathway pseudopilin PulG